MEETYMNGVDIIAFVTFIISWIVFTINSGLIGFCLGWLPSIFISVIIGFTYPLILAVILAYGCYIWYAFNFLK